MLQSSREGHHSGGSGGLGASALTKLTLAGLMLTILLGGCGFVFVARQFGAATEAAAIATAQAAHTEQKTKILENELHKFRRDFQKTMEALHATADGAGEIEGILKRLDQAEMDILDIDFDLNDRIDELSAKDAYGYT